MPGFSIYDCTASWADNQRRGPCFEGASLQREPIPQELWLDFFGHKVRYPTVMATRHGPTCPNPSPNPVASHTSPKPRPTDSWHTPDP